MPYASAPCLPMPNLYHARSLCLMPCTTVNCFTLGSRPDGVACPCGVMTTTLSPAAGGDACLPLPSALIVNCDNFHIMLNSLWGIFLLSCGLCAMPYAPTMAASCLACPCPQPMPHALHHGELLHARQQAIWCSLPLCGDNHYLVAHALCIARAACLPMPYVSCHACLMPCLPMPSALIVDCDSFNIMLNRGMPKKVMGLRLVVGRPIDLWQRMVGLWL